jgi:hypothetical protein
MPYHNRLDRIFAPATTNGNGHHPMPDHDAKIEEHETRLAARFRIQSVIAVLAILTLGGGLYLIARAVDSGLAHVAAILSAR